MQKIKINARQFLILVTFFSMGTSILIIPSALAGGAKQAAWVVAIIGTVFGLVIIWLFSILAKRFPTLTFVQMNEKILGKWLGKALSLLFVGMSLLYTIALLFYSGTFLNTHLLPSTPMMALNALLVAVIIFGVWLGLETVARAGEIFILLFFVLFILLVFFILPEIKLENLQPIIEVGPKAIFFSSLPLIEVSAVNAVVLLMIFPAVINNVQQAKKTFFIGYLIGGMVISILTFLCIAVLGAYSTASEIHPSYELAKRINIGNFIQRIEALMAGLWIIALYFKATIYFYASVVGIAQIFNKKDYKPFTIPLGIIVLLLSLVIYPSVMYQNQWNGKVGIYISYSIGLLLPLLLLIVATLRKSHVKK